jgi:hypothetical protein
MEVVDALPYQEFFLNAFETYQYGIPAFILLTVKANFEVQFSRRNINTERQKLEP